MQFYQYFCLKMFEQQKALKVIVTLLQIETQNLKKAFYGPFFRKIYKYITSILLSSKKDVKYKKKTHTTLGQIIIIF